MEGVDDMALRNDGQDRQEDISINRWHMDASMNGNGRAVCE